MSDYDLIVVGAGSSGAALASRVSEDPGWHVLLLEGGPDFTTTETPPSIRDVWPLGIFADPGLMATHLWADVVASRSSRQPASQYLQGRGVGGSSAVNGLFAIRPTVEDLDGWAAAGCAGWRFDDALPALNRLESDLAFGSEPFHGASGPLPISRPSPDDFQPLEAAFHSASERLGHGWEPDHNAPGSTGVSPYAYNARAGRRFSTNDAYLEPARGRPNLTIIGDKRVTEVLFDGDRAVGIRAVCDGTSAEYRAAHTVLAAGVFQSPAILMRSGIGPADRLRDLGISVRHDLPVGIGLQDHPAITAVVNFTEDTVIEAADRRHSRCCLRFDSGVGDDPNDLMIVAMNPAGTGHFGHLVGWVNKVDSRGRVTLRSADPSLPPVIQFDMLSRAADLHRMRRVVGELNDLLEQPELRKIAAATDLVLDAAAGAARSPMPRPTDEALEEVLLTAVHDVSHATSTCRMGSADDGTAVVDSSGRVHGLDGLRVADASVLPSVPRANTHLSAVLVGEMVAADLLAGSR